MVGPLPKEYVFFFISGEGLCKTRIIPYKSKLFYIKILFAFKRTDGQTEVRINKQTDAWTSKKIYKKRGERKIEHRRKKERKIFGIKYQKEEIRWLDYTGMYR